MESIRAEQGRRESRELSWEGLSIEPSPVEAENYVNRPHLLSLVLRNRG